MVGSGLQVLGIANFAGAIAVALIQVLGIVISARVVRRNAGQGALFSLIGFSLLFSNTAFRWLLNYLILPRMQMSVAMNDLNFAVTLFSCLAGLLTAGGFLMIILGVWRLAADRSHWEEDLEEDEEDEDEDEDVELLPPADEDLQAGANQ